MSFMVDSLIYIFDWNSYAAARVNTLATNEDLAGRFVFNSTQRCDKMLLHSGMFQ